MMKLRTCLSLLALCASFGTATHSASAQQPAPTDQVKEVARQRYSDGVKAYDAGRFEDARLAFEQAYQLTQVPAVLYNLALAESRLGKTVASGNHMLQFLRDAKDATEDKRSAAKAAVEDAKRKACLVTITVDAAGADVSVDGTAVGKSPLPDPVFVDLGARTIVASVNGKTGLTKLDAKSGTSSVAVVTGATTMPTSPGTGTPDGPGAGTGPGTGSPTGPGNTTGPGTPYGPGTYGPGTANPYGPGSGTPPSTGGREDFFHWYARKPLAWVGTGVFAVGLGLGIGFSAAAAGTKSDSESIADQIRAQAASDGVSGSPCGPEDSSGSGDVYPGPCNQLRDALSAHSTNTAMAVVGWVAAGVGAAGTVTYIMVDWFANDAPADDAGGPPRAQIVPIIGPAYIGVTGQF